MKDQNLNQENTRNVTQKQKYKSSNGADQLFPVKQTRTPKLTQGTTFYQYIENFVFAHKDIAQPTSGS